MSRLKTLTLEHGSTDASAAQAQAVLAWERTPEHERFMDGSVKFLTAALEEEAANLGRRRPPCRLTRATNIRPRKSASMSAQSRWSDCERLRVTERHWREYGHDVEKLRQHQMLDEPATLATLDLADCAETPDGGQKSELDMSFKSAFRLRCQLPSVPRDPWRGVENPEYTRDLTGAADRIVNEVYPQSPKSDPFPLFEEAACSSRSTRREGHRNNCERPSSGSRPSSGRARGAASGATPSAVSGTIMLLDDFEETPTRKCGDPHDKDSILWLSVDPRTGEVQPYPRAAAQRLEAGHCSGQKGVPLGGLGLGPSFDGAVVLLGGGAGELPKQRTLRGGLRDVRRIELAPGASSATVHVVGGRPWRIVDFDSPGAEERVVEFTKEKLVYPCGTVLPPLVPNRQFLGAPWPTQA